LPDAPSPTPLYTKLGLKDGMRTLLIDAPTNYRSLLGTSLPRYHEIPLSAPPFDLVHLFVTSRPELERHIPFLRSTILPDGMIWVSWPKKSSKVSTDITEDTIREIALSHDLVDVKVCAVDSTWSALKLVIPRALRPRHVAPSPPPADTNW